MKTSLIILFSFVVLHSSAQQNVSPLKQVIAYVDSFRKKLPVEKLFLHFDKPYYAVGDTIWFKAYLLDASTNAYSSLSGLLYFELINSDNKLVRRLSWPVSFGVSWGQVALENDLSEGTYLVRAYTNWMQNFGEQYFFQQQLSVGAMAGNHWLVKEAHSIVANGKNEEMVLKLQLATSNSRPVVTQDVTVQIMDGEKTVYKSDVQTLRDGSLSEQFAIPAALKSSALVAVVTDKVNPNKKAIIPLLLQRTDKIDLQFMPEGGHLVAGLLSTVAFKAVAENGLAIDVEGSIVDSKEKEVARFQSVHKGMGKFELTPADGEKYFALLKLPGGDVRRYLLPAPKSSGPVMRIDQGTDDSLALSLSFSPSLLGDKVYHLVGLSRGTVCYAANVPLDQAERFSRIAKSKFPTGIAHFTLFDEANRPLAERIVFINRHDGLHIRVNPSAAAYHPHDSIALDIQVTDGEDHPVVGSFSLAVTDDKQIMQKDDQTILSAILLTSDLKGNIENPSYYFISNDAKALDLLLLTQGWTGYDWTQILNGSRTPVFAAEQGFCVKGRVTNLLGKPAKGAKVVLLSTGKGQLARDTTANDDGKFVFCGIPAGDKMSFVVQGQNSKGKSIGMGVAMESFTPATMPQSPFLQKKPWYVNSDTVDLVLAKNNTLLRRQMKGINDDAKLMDEVVIKTKKIIKGSENLNGPGEADQVLDMAEIEKLGSRTLEEILKENVRGFQVFPGPETPRYSINNQRLLLRVDGIDVRKLGGSANEFIYNNSLTAEDIVGIEVMHSGRFNSRYDAAILSVGELMRTDSRPYAYLEITTRSGNGFFAKKTPGVVVYKPVPLNWPRQFYRPVYTPTASENNVKDLRSTIHWQPNVITNNDGHARVSFYAADTPSTYSVIVQGSDMNGSVGYQKTTLTVSDKKGF